MYSSSGYGYGFLSVFLISSFSLAGAAVFPLTKKRYYKYFNAFFTALAVGALFANCTFELMPAVCIVYKPMKKHNNYYSIDNHIRHGI
jgi:hypothetical protein